MRRWILVPIILITTIIAAGCSGTQQQVEQQIRETPALLPVTMVPPTTPSIPTPISQALVSDNTVTIKDFAFTPQTITVNKGDIVRWENMDPAPHRIMFTDSSGRDTSAESGVLASYQSWSTKFESTGTYSYYCKIHPAMKGTVVVK